MTNESLDFGNCPVGKLNEQKIEHTAELFSKDLKMAIEKLEGKMDVMNTKIDTRFDTLDDKIDNLDRKVHALDEKMKGVDNIKEYVEQEITNRLENSTKDKVFNFFKWVIVVLLGGTSVTVLGKLALKLLNLN